MKNYNTKMVPDPKKPGWFMPADADIMEQDTLAWLDEIGSSDEKILSSAYGIKFGELAIYTEKTIQRKNELEKRLTELEKLKRAQRDSKLPPVIIVKCDCGHSVSEILVMAASMGSACPSCYDRLSN